MKELEIKKTLEKTAKGKQSKIIEQNLATSSHKDAIHP
jgi:hypothetical protein